MKKEYFTPQAGAWEITVERSLLTLSKGTAQSGLEDNWDTGEELDF